MRRIFRLATIAFVVSIGAAFAGSLVSGGSLEEARRRYQSTDYAAAIAKLNGASDAASLLLAGQSYVMIGEYKKGTEVLERVAALDPNESNAFLWLGRAYGRRAENAIAVAAPAFAIKARANFEKAVALNPQNWEALDDLFEFYLEAPGFLGGGIDKAAKLTEAIAEHDPSEAFSDRARIAEHRKQYDVAEANLRRALQIAPEKLGRVTDLARFLAKHGRFDESDRFYQQAFQSAPNSPRVVFSRAHSLIETNRNLPEARELLKRYLSFNLTPDDPPRHDAERLLRKAAAS